MNLPPAFANAPLATRPVKPRQAASLIVLRDSPRGPEVLMLRRADKPGDQNSGATVFPGGLLDAADAGHYELCTGLADAAASARLGLPAGGLDYWIAAVRECFEEAGLLFAAHASGGLVALDAHDADQMVELCRALHAGRIYMSEVCRRLDVKLAMTELTYRELRTI